MTWGHNLARLGSKKNLYQLFNFRYNAELPTVITSATDLEEMDPRLRSRIFDKRLCTIHAITAPTYTGSARRQQKPTSSDQKSSSIF